MWADIGVVFWRDYRAFRGAFWNRLAIFVVVAILSGVIVPWMFMKGGVAKIDLWSRLIDFSLFFTCYVFSGMISSSSFHSECQNSTLHILLASALRPHCLFIGKWLWMMMSIGILLLSTLALSRIVILSWEGFGWPSISDVWFTVGMLIFTLSSCSWVIAANSITSLAIREPKSAQMVGSLAGVLPFLLVLAIVQVFGMQIGTGLIPVAGIICVVFAVGSFCMSVALFRSERIRL